MRNVQRSARLTSCAALLVLAGACGSQTSGPSDSGGDSGAGAPNLDGHWRLTSATALPLDDAHPITLDLAGDQASGTSACNRYSGTMTTTSGTVGFGRLGGTEMACLPPSVMELEQAYLAALQRVDAADLVDGVLTLTGPDVSLTFASVPPVPDADLVGTTWLLESLVDGDSASSVAGDPATLDLHPNGTLVGATGCRTFRAGWQRDGSEVAVDALASDKRGCPADLRQQDVHVLAALRDGFTVAVEGDVLTVTAASGKGLVYRRR